MPDQQYPPQNPTAPREPAYGEVKETEDLESAVSTPTEPPVAEAEPMPAPQVPAPAIEQGPPKNIVGVLPPDNFAPSQTGMVDIPPEVRTAKTILAIPGIDASVRGLAMAILNKDKFPGPGYYQGEIPTQPPEDEYDTSELGEL